MASSRKGPATQNKCLIMNNNGQDTSPSRYLWSGGDNGNCGFATRADLPSNKQAVWTISDAILGSIPAMPASGTVISMFARADSRYVCADNAGATALIANRDVVGPWEKFELLDLGNGNVALRAMADGQLVTADSGGASPLIANRTAVGPWETFQWVNLGSGDFALKAAANGRYVSAANGGASALIANQTAIGLSETFHWSPVSVSAATIAQYAPKVWLAGGEKYFPASMGDFLPSVHDEVISGQTFKVTTQPLGCDSCTDPSFLYGKSPAQNQVPVYAEIVDRTQNGQPTNVTDVIYWMFYPYNNGKRVCIGFYLPGSFGVPTAPCAGLYSTFGNHVGDWEHVTVRFVDGVPSQVALSQHSNGQVFNYGDPALQLSDGHPVVFAAEGSHGLYPDAAQHNYQQVGIFENLHDDTSAGVMWDTQAAVVTFRPQGPPQVGSLSWLNFSGRWGNPKSGCSIEFATGECVLNAGPSSILPRAVSSSALLPVE